ncbi:MAG: 50S ribosomal protein L23 [Chlamydiae bacterium]|nr:50S ribosomal protein L23 [Chlamydiota bacterium]MBI3277734.1 50S ribosomal protein L23 [Chlamydiota bacterium]
MKAPSEIILEPLISEKGTELLQKENKVLFKVHMNSNKIDVRHAIEQIYSVKVLQVNTVKVKGKPKRVRYHMGRTSNWKKAIVTLKEGEKIDFA